MSPHEGWKDLVDFSKKIWCSLSCNLLFLQRNASCTPYSQNLPFKKFLSRWCFVILSSKIVFFVVVVHGFLLPCVSYMSFSTFFIEPISENRVVSVWKVGSSHQSCSVKKVFLEISQNSQESTCARVSFLIKVQASGTGVLL